MDELIETLDMYWERNADVVPDEGEAYAYLSADSDDKLSLTLDTLCWKYLTAGPWIHQPNALILKAHGYEVWAGDQDSFGVLTICIGKDDKCFVIG